MKKFLLNLQINHLTVGEKINKIEVKKFTMVFDCHNGDPITNIVLPKEIQGVRLKNLTPFLLICNIIPNDGAKIMDLNISIKATEVVAWWGAIVATLVLFWDIVKWRSAGLRIKFRVYPNMIVIGNPEYEGKTYISAKASNIGGKQTTINTLVGHYYKSLLSKLRKKPDKSFVVNEESAHPLPYIIQPGTNWSGLMLQLPEIEEMAKTGILIFELWVSNKKRPITSRLYITQ